MPPSAIAGATWLGNACASTTCVSRVGGADLGREYLELIEAYDHGGLPFERALSRLSYARWLIEQNRVAEATDVAGIVRGLGQTYGMKIMEADAWRVAADLGGVGVDPAEEERLRAETGYLGPIRP